MDSENKLRTIVPVLPSSDIERDIKWYETYTGFKVGNKEKEYAILNREHLWIHLQWHANTENDPLLGGSVIKIFVTDIEALFQEFVNRTTVSKHKLRQNTPWGTKEFGVYDLNKNAIFFVEKI